MQNLTKEVLGAINGGFRTNNIFGDERYLPWGFPPNNGEFWNRIVSKK